MNSVNLVGKIKGDLIRQAPRVVSFVLAVPRPNGSTFDFVPCLALGKVTERIPQRLTGVPTIWIGGRLRREAGELVVAVHDFEVV